MFPLAQSGEIFPVSAMQAVPYAMAWFRGVVNLRGGLYGVVDTAAFAAPDLPPTRAHKLPPGAEAVVVTLNAVLDVNCALLVDSLAGLRKADSFTSAQAPATDAAPYLGNRFTDAEGESWQEINLQTLSQLPRFLNITA